MNSMNPSGLLQIKEVAAFLKFSDKTIRRLIDSGKLDTVKIGGRRLVKEVSLQTLIQRGTA